MQGILPQQNITHSPKLLDQAQGILRAKHYSLKTEQSYINWMKRHILFHNKRHPREMGEAEISRFLTYLAVKRKYKLVKMIKKLKMCCYFAKAG